MNQPNTNLMSRRSLLGRGFALGALGVGGAMIGVRPGFAQDLTEVKLQLGWLVTNGCIGEIVAQSMGYYKEQGLNLTITPGGPNIDGVAAVASGAANMGSISSSPSLMLARSEGIPVKCVATGYQQHPFTYFSLAKNPVKTPQDMIGKKIGTNATAKILLQALLAKHNIPEDQVEVVVVGSDVGPLLSGQVDVITGWQTTVALTEAMGADRVEMRLWDQGVQLLANPYYVTDDTLANNFDVVVKMINAGSRGWGWVYENPEKAVDIMVEAYPNMDRDNELAAIPMVLKYVFNAQTAANGWGTMTAENWQAQIDAYNALGQFQGTVPTVDDVMTLKVLEATADVRPKLGS
ncbi:ABC transporter substrate-binding protein [Paracoccus pacificus]|uniref:Thiamine pyrimidine synthase n=1 Tax=Paracoccus pacificus TaxID=1463598 RepID=A0ABW4R6B4_9RHOB